LNGQVIALDKRKKIYGCSRLTKNYYLLFDSLAPSSNLKYGTSIYLELKVISIETILAIIPEKKLVTKFS